MLRAVIFDFDGVIADSETMHFDAFNHCLEPYGIRISKQEYYNNYLGLSDIDLLIDLHESGTLDVDETQLAVIAENKKQLFKKLTDTDTAIIDGVRQFLKLLKDNDIAIAICSGALLCEIESILNRASLQEYFETIVSADQVAKSKPAPDGFLLALERLNINHTPAISAGQCVVIEDSRWGLKAGNAAGMKTIAVTNSYPADQLKSADMVVKHLNELTLEQMNTLCA